MHEPRAYYYTDIFGVVLINKPGTFYDAGRGRLFALSRKPISVEVPEL